MSTHRPREDYDDYRPLWRDIAPSVLMLLALVAVMTVLALVLSHYIGPLRVEP